MNRESLPEKLQEQVTSLENELQDLYRKFQSLGFKLYKNGYEHGAYVMAGSSVVLYDLYKRLRDDVGGESDAVHS